MTNAARSASADDARNTDGSDRAGHDDRADRVTGTMHSLPHTALSRRIDGWLTGIASAVGWLWLVLLGVIVLNVTLRYVFGQGRIEFEEIQWHLYATGFLLAQAGTVATDHHVRVDVLHGRLRPRLQAWIELYGLILLFFPFVLLVLVFAVPFTLESWKTGEVSVAPGGLPARWLIKAMLPLGFALLLLAGFARLLRVWSALFGTPRAVQP